MANSFTVSGAESTVSCNTINWGRWGTDDRRGTLNLIDDAAVRRGAAWLLAHGADPNRVCYPEQSGETPLHAAAGNGHTEAVRVLLSHGARVNDMTPHLERTALHAAALADDAAVLALAERLRSAR